MLQRLCYLMRNGWGEEVRKKGTPIVLDEGTDKDWARLILQRTSCVHNLSTIQDGGKEHIPSWKDRLCFASLL